MNTGKISLGDRYAEIAVVVVTIVALLAGLLVKDNVTSRSVPFASFGIQAAAPADWIQSAPEGDVVLKVRERNTFAYQTNYAISKLLLSADSGRLEAVSLTTLQQAQTLNSFRILDQRTVTIGGREAYEVQYVFVESNPNITHADVPVIVLGVDYYFTTHDGALIVTYRAAQANFENGLARFHLFLESVQF